MTAKSEGAALLAQRRANGRALAEEARERKKPRDIQDPHLSKGEKMLWAAAFADEYRRAIIGVIPHYRAPQTPLKAAEYAALYAFGAVTAARQAVREPPNTITPNDQPSLPLAKEFLSNMIGMKRSRG